MILHWGNLQVLKALERLLYNQKEIYIIMTEMTCGDCKAIIRSQLSKTNIRATKCLNVCR